MKPAARSAAPFVSTRRPLPRRRFLQGAGIALSLPFLESMLPSFAARRDVFVPARTGREAAPDVRHLQQSWSARRSVFPDRRGSRLRRSRPICNIFKAHRNDFTVFSGVSHPECRRRPSGRRVLPHRRAAPGQQFVPQHDLARPAYCRAHRHAHALSVAYAGRQHAHAGAFPGPGTGVAIPPEDKAAEVFKQLFFQGSPAQVAAQIRKLDTGRSILDTVAGQAKELQRNVGTRDRDRLDQYFTSVRDLEHRLQASAGWEQKPKPVVDAPTPIDPGEPDGLHGKSEDHVRPRAPRVRNRFDARHHPHARQRQHAGRSSSTDATSRTAITISRTTGSRRKNAASSRRSTSGT